MGIKSAIRTTVVTGSAVAAAVFGAPGAAADPSEWPQPGSQPADAILMQLERMGYAVGINWIDGGQGEPLSQCRVTGYHAPGSTSETDPASTTVYMDVICPFDD
jgi:hypothetical protein